MKKVWLITGVSSGFGYEMTKQLLEKGNTVIGTVRNTEKVKEFIEKYPDTFDCRFLDVTDGKAVEQTVQDSFEKHGKVDVVVSNAGYGLFGCVEELKDEEIQHIVATNLILLKTAVPYMRKQGGGRLIQMSSYGGQVAYAANSMYHATKFGMEGFCEALAQEVAQFNIGVTVVEPGGARTEFRYGSAKVAKLMPEYENCRGFLNMLNPANGLAPGDPAKMAQRIIESTKKRLCRFVWCLVLRRCVQHWKDCVKESLIMKHRLIWLLLRILLSKENRIL